MPFDLHLDVYKDQIIYIFEFSGVLGQEDYDLFKSQFNICLAGKPFVCIFNLYNVISAPPNLILAQAQYMKEYESVAKTKLIASSIILTSKIIKGLLQSLFKIKSPVAPNYVTGDLNEGIEFVKDHIELYTIKRAKK